MVAPPGLPSVALPAYTKVVPQVPSGRSQGAGLARFTATSTRVTPTLSLAVPVRVVVRGTVAPAVGEVRVPVGAVVSGGGVPATVKATAALVALWLVAASRARALTLYEPLAGASKDRDQVVVVPPGVPRVVALYASVAPQVPLACSHWLSEPRWMASSTTVTPTLSVAVPLMVVGSPTVAPGVGAEIVTAGAVPSTGGVAPRSKTWTRSL